MYITVTSNKNFEKRNIWNKWRNRFKREKYVVLVEYLEEQIDYRRYKRRNRKSRRGPSWRCYQPYLFTFPYGTNGNHATELSTVSPINLRTALENPPRFHWNCKQIRVEARNSMSNCQIYFPLFAKTIQQYWKYFRRIVFGSVSRDYSKRNRVLQFLVKIFG